MSFEPQSVISSKSRLDCSAISNLIIENDVDKKIGMNLQKIDSPQISEGISPNASDLVGVDEEQLQRGQSVEDLSREAGDPVAVENPVVEIRN